MTTALFSPDELAQICGGKWLNGVPDGVFSLNTDSRTIRDGECFVPLVGERFDGHDFLARLAGSGKKVCALCGKDRPAPAGLPVLPVADTLQAYQALGAFHRGRMTHLKVIGVTGSVGKTSVKEMLRAIFSSVAGAEQVLYTEGNTNNQIGVVQNLLRLTPEHRFAVIEMGTNHPGEIAPLARIARPDAALVNSIAPCHLEFLGDLDGVAREKSAIFSGTRSGGGAVCPEVCAGNAILRDAAAHAKLHLHTFGAWGTPGAAVTGRILKDTLYGSQAELCFTASGRTVAFDWNLAGDFQALNAAAAAAMALHFGLTPEAVAAGLRATELPGKRMKVEERNNICWINDAYNANPASMAASLRHLRTAGGTARDYLLVLGDMRELGSDALRHHRDILALAQSLFAATRCQLFLLGETFGTALREGDFPAAWRHFASLEELRSALKDELADGRERTVFLKSSNGLKLHTLEPFA